VVRQIGRHPERLCAGQQARATHRRVERRKQPLDLATGILAAPEADEHLGLIGRAGRFLDGWRLGGIGRVDHDQRGRHVQLDFRMARREAGQMADQPAGHEGRRRRDEQATALVVAPGAVDGGGEGIEPLAHLGQHGPPLGGQFDGARQPVKQGKAEVVLEAADLVADGGRRHRQLFAGQFEAQVAGGGLEGAQGVQGGQSIRHTAEIFSRID